jgi:iduronate 2-sulfatase
MQKHLLPLTALVLGGNLLAGEAAPPNILMIIADDLRAELGAYGSQQAISPHLDRLAAQGTSFERAYCQQPVCNPSRASALTGLRPDRLRVWDLRTHFREIMPEVMSLPEYFKRHGYHTRGIGKVFHNETRQPPYLIPMDDPVSWSAPPVLSRGPHWKDWHVPAGAEPLQSKMEAWQCLDAPDEAYYDGQIAAHACASLEELAGSGEPFFLAVGFWKPHLPFNAPKQYWDLYQRDSFAGVNPAEPPEGAPKRARHNWRELRGYKGMPDKGPLTAEEQALLRHGYFACISFLDTQVGRVLDQLRASGLEENTIVVFWSDHGFHLGEHDLWGKTSMYELDARVPLIFAGPGIRRGARTSALAELVDLFPTLAELAGLPAPLRLDGRSLRPNIDDPRLPGREAALTQSPSPPYARDWTAMAYALRTDRYRYVEWRERHSGEILARELYDHSVDPAESRNLVDDPGHRAALEEIGELAARSYHYDPGLHGE